MLSRRGLTLIELLVALVLAAIILGSATTSLLKQQHTHVMIRSSASADQQRRATMAVIAGQLGLLDASAGDVSAGEARDTVIQIRAAIATSVSCGVGIGSVTLSPESDANHAVGGTASQADVGDSLWWRGDSTWIGAEITDVAHVTAACLGLPVTQTVRIALSRSDTIPDGSPVHIGRLTRYGIYKSGDGTWQLGFREWNSVAHAWSAPQPVTGPLVQKNGARRSGFRYFDDGGAELPIIGGSASASAIARVRLTAHSLLAVRERGQDSIQSDSIDVALAHHHAP